jgi:chemotaxis protein CheD
MGEIIVKMGDLAVATGPGHVLASIGLGSCVGVALVSRSRAVAGLAHVMLPEAPTEGSAGPRYADYAVPALVRELAERGAPKDDLDAALVGGAQMFTFDGSTMEIGLRNERAVRAALESEGIPVRAAATAGSTGRTIRVHVATGEVTCKEAGGALQPLLRARTTTTTTQRSTR